MECPHCHAQIPAGSVTCPECGSAQTARDEGVTAELGQANLLRMRGDLRGAESQLLSLLKKYPNNATAHEMLGDIYHEEKEDAQAAQWYELALDLAPSTPGLATKLELAKERLVKSEEQTQVEQIGLAPVSRTPFWVWPVVALGTIAIIALAAVLILNRKAEPKFVQSQIIAPPQTAPEPTSISPAPTISPSVTPTEPLPVANVSQDQAALQNLAQYAADGPRLTTLTTDPRGQTMQLTFTLHPAENPRAMGARLARAALEQFPACSTVTVRASLDGNLIYVADGVRTRLTDIQRPDWQKANPGEDAWQAYLLTNEWVASGANVPAVQTPNGGSSTSNIVPVNTP